MIQKPIPAFRSEAEEAEWWDAHSDEVDEWMEEAIKAGQTTTLAEHFERRQREAAKPTISIDPIDMTRAQSMASKKGLSLPAYVKMLVHDALDREERRAS